MNNFSIVTGVNSVYIGNALSSADTSSLEIGKAVVEQIPVPSHLLQTPASA